MTATLTTPPLVIDFDAWHIGEQTMTRAERAVLLVLLESPGRAASKLELFRAMWPNRVPLDAYGRLTSRAISTIISRLRAKGVGPLENVWGYGWRLPADHLDVRLPT